MTQLLSKIPPTGLVLLAISGVQFGAVFATSLFAHIGADGAVAARIVLSALLLILVSHGRVSGYLSLFRQHWQVLITFGLCIAVMNYFFYQAIARIPLGAAVAIEFAGPLGVALLASRGWRQLSWVALAALGIILLTPLSGAQLNLTGVVYALMAGAAWALFILLAGVVSKKIPSNDGLVIAMIVAALVLLPILAPVVPRLVSDVTLVAIAFAVAVLSTAIPFVFEFEALRHLTARVYGVLVSLEPAAAAVVGWALLDENIGVRGTLAVSCVVIAAIGITLADSKKTVVHRD